jgi:hypothetical protein
VRELAPLAAGVSAPYRFGNLTTPHIRGDVAESYRNGQRIGANLFGVNPGFNAYDSVTLGRGPGGVVNGAGQYTGGFVSYSTKQARREATTTTLSTTLGAWPRRSWSTRAGVTTTTSRWRQCGCAWEATKGSDDRPLPCNGGRTTSRTSSCGFWQVTEPWPGGHAQYRGDGRAVNCWRQPPPPAWSEEASSTRAPGPTAAKDRPGS